MELLLPDSPLIKAKKIAVVRLDGLGDSILALPALRLLQKACPWAEITVIASQIGAPVFQDTFETAVFNLKETGFTAKLAEFLKGRSYDVIFSFTEKGQTLEAIRLSGVNCRCGFFPGISQPLKSLSLLRQLNHRVYFNNTPGRSNKLHETERFCLLLAELGMKIPPVSELPDLTFKLSQPELESGQKVFKDTVNLKTAGHASIAKEGAPAVAPSPKAFCAIQLMPRWHSNLPTVIKSQTTLPALGTDSPLHNRRFSFFWPLLHPVVELYIKLLGQQIQPIFTFAPPDQEWVKLFLQDFSTAFPYNPPAPHFSTQDLRLFCAFLKNCAFMVTPDGGAAHLAAAASLPVIAIFPAKNVKANVSRWKPWRVPCQVVVRDQEKQDKQNEAEEFVKDLYEASLKTCP